MLASPVRASGSSVEVPVALSFQVSGVAKATDSVLGDFSPGPGKIDITSGDHAMYVRLTGPAGNGTRLTSMDDYESGIAFRNNTFLLPLYMEGKNAGALIVTTDNLTADSYGYSGIITGLELDSGKIATSYGGHNFIADVLVSLASLPTGGSYRVAFVNDSAPEEAIAGEFEAFGMAMGAMTPTLEVSAGDAASGNALSFVIITIEAEGNWTGLNSDRNLTFFRYTGDGLSSLRFTAKRSGNGTMVYQAVSPGTGQFLMADPVPREMAREAVSTGGTDIFLLGGLLAVLVIALAAMVRRVTKR
jgi:hypothetical protein